ncbi:hypothetical protein [Rhizobium sp. BK602]|uniref:hypothetical protein n=1 Tax=Rhizobium sp. BK602 TaxID=2586986 RepID=UPI001619C601|nr:hypothetical protein [Rhizobium sp. BK602]MBB3612809.1 hypothetical protein [Rhizobium sp. BK602]
MSAEPPASPEAKLARILAWLHEKFTRNFSVGKDLWELPKSRSEALIFGQFRSQTAILLASGAKKAGARRRREALEIRIPEHIDAVFDDREFHEWHRRRRRS